MHQELQKLHQTITSLCDGTCSQQEINQFAKLCLKMAVVNLRVLEGRGQRIRETGDQSELQGIASDCIADLFVQNKDGSLPQLQKYFASRITEDQRADDLLILLRQLIAHKVRQHLTKFYAQRDPDGAKLIRNIRLATTRFKELQIYKDITGEYISFSNTKTQNHRICRHDYLDLQNAFSFIFRGDYSVDKLVFKVLSKLSDDFESFVEVRILDLVKLIRHYRSVIERNESTESTVDPLYYQREVELKKKVVKIVDRLNEKISDKYITKNKLSLDEGIAVSKALKDMAKDALDGERLQENYYYLQKHWISLTREEYFVSVRKIFEYFVRLFKDEVRKIAMDNSD